MHAQFPEAEEVIPGLIEPAGTPSWYSRHHPGACPDVPADDSAIVNPEPAVQVTLLAWTHPKPTTTSAVPVVENEPAASAVPELPAPSYAVEDRGPSRWAEIQQSDRRLHGVPEGPRRR